MFPVHHDTKQKNDCLAGSNFIDAGEFCSQPRSSSAPVWCRCRRGTCPWLPLLDGWRLCHQPLRSLSEVVDEVLTVQCCGDWTLATSGRTSWRGLSAGSGPSPLVQILLHHSRRRVLLKMFIELKKWPDRIRVGWRWLASSDGRAANTTHPHGHVHARDGQGLHKKNDEGTTWTRVLFVGWRHSSRWSYIVGEWLSLSSVKKRMQVQWCDSLGSNYVVFLVYLASKYIKHGSWNCSFYHLSRRNTIF